MIFENVPVTQSPHMMLIQSSLQWLRVRWACRSGTSAYSLVLFPLYSEVVTVLCWTSSVNAEGRGFAVGPREVALAILCSTSGLSQIEFEFFRQVRQSPLSPSRAVRMQLD